ncbi:MAG: deoxyribose-phosphate aldolase [Spirochaetales bacterium]|uniref:Deoxyribose-phosphate aldolase n=1 Tax=Candidatus Thalassospirochaeta sargassi TaxID=3119039 RepID=A0AAJ1MLH7_9SPIO|nr:deoxyribose-phosphate aldolase [Spirochaetales bacterium]
MSLTNREIAQMMDLSCVQAFNTLDEIRDAAATAMKHDCICVFALPAHIPYLVDLLKERKDILIGGTVGFPDGAATTAGKVHEALELIEMGVNELDMVINIGWLKAGEYDLFANDIKQVIKAADGMPVKVILECHYLTREEIVKACEIAVECGASFVKTGTGWAPSGATVENIKLMSDTVGDSCKVKAAGGVRDKETLLAMHASGAVRFGVGARTALAILN